MHSQRRLSYAQGYLGLGMVAEAAAELARIPAPDSEALDVIAVRLAVLQEQKDWPALSAAAGALVRRSPGEAAAWVTWAYATRRADSLAAAEKILREAELHHPKEPTIQFNLGCYACLRGDLAGAAATDPDLAPLRTGKSTA